MNSNFITVTVTINDSIESVWQKFIDPKHIVNWSFPLDTWHCPSATLDFEINGEFCYKMGKKDDSIKFDFCGIYDLIETHKRIEYTVIDGRKVIVIFTYLDHNITQVTEMFAPEDINSKGLQQKGWNEVLINFKKYVENLDDK
jgi:uncharacterized protein YndB with AHSA1/START domain